MEEALEEVPSKPLSLHFYSASIGPVLEGKHGACAKPCYPSRTKTLESLGITRPAALILDYTILCKFYTGSYEN